MNHELNKNDSQLLEVNLLNQLKLAKRVNLFDYSLEELQAVHEYWRSMNRYSKQVLNMANIVNFTDKQFENRLNDNLEELVQVKKRLNRQPLFYLVGNQGQGKPVCEEDD